MLAYVAYAAAPLTREERAARATAIIQGQYADRQQAFLDFVLAHYVRDGVEDLDRSKLKPLLSLQYGAVSDAILNLGPPEDIGQLFVGFQKYLYSPSAGTE